MSITNAAVSFRTVEAVKSEAFKIIEQYGMTPSQVFNMFMREIVHTKTIPVRLDYLKPNARTLAAIEELENGQGESFYIEQPISAEAFTNHILENEHSEK